MGSMQNELNLLTFPYVLIIPERFNHLGREEEPYEILVDYYKDRDHEKALEIASIAIQKCQKDQTSFFVFLLQAAKDRKDEAAFKKLMQSAHKRRAVKSSVVDELFS